MKKKQTNNKKFKKIKNNELKKIKGGLAKDKEKKPPQKVEPALQY